MDPSKKTPPKKCPNKKGASKSPPAHSVPKAFLERIRNSKLPGDPLEEPESPIFTATTAEESQTSSFTSYNTFQYAHRHHATIKLKTNSISWSNKARNFASCPVSVVVKEEGLNKRRNLLFVNGGVDSRGVFVDKCFFYDFETEERIAIPKSPNAPPPQSHHKCLHNPQRDEITVVSLYMTHIYTLTKVSELENAQWTTPQQLPWGPKNFIGQLRSLHLVNMSTEIRQPLLIVVEAHESYKVIVPHFEALVNDSKSPVGQFSFVVTRVENKIVLYAVGVATGKNRISIWKIEWDDLQFANLHRKCGSMSYVPHFLGAKWERVNMVGVPPPFCTSFSVAVLRESLFMYGGRLNNEESLCSFYRFNLLTETWDIVLPLFGREHLKPISGHSMSYADQNTAIVLGGEPHTNDLLFVSGFVTLNYEHEIPIATHLHKIWTKKTVYDCLIEVSDGPNLEAHCCVLSARCPGLRAELREKISCAVPQTDDERVVVRLSEFSKFSTSAVMSFLEFVYTGEFGVAQENVEAFCKMTTLTKCGKKQVALLLSDYSSVNLHHYSEWAMEYLKDIESLLGENGEPYADATVTTETAGEPEELIPPSPSDDFDPPLELTPEMPVHAHRHHLAVLCRNKHLKRVFSGPFAEARTRVLRVPDQDQDALDVLIKYLYTDCLTLTAENCITVYNVALILQFTEVLQICRNAISDFINPDTVLSIALFGESTQDQMLLSRCKSFIAARHSTLSKKGEYRELSEAFRLECSAAFLKLQQIHAKRKKKEFVKKQGGKKK